jgi:hypothetical protein
MCGSVPVGPGSGATGTIVPYKRPLPLHAALALEEVQHVEVPEHVLRLERDAAGSRDQVLDLGR